MIIDRIIKGVKAKTEISLDTFFIKLFTYSFLLFFLCISLPGFSQQKVELVQADDLLFHADISGAQRLIGNVILKFDSTVMHCDSAWVYPVEDYFDAWGHIRINGNDAKITGDSLHIDRDNNEAQIMGDVFVRDKEMTLKTKRVDYNLETKVASYYGGGVIDSKTNSNKLTSDVGYYDTESKFFNFRGNVVLNNPDYTIHSDTLKYSDPNEKAWFLGPTTIESKDGTTIYCEDGWYETKTDNSVFRKNSKILFDSTTLEADSIKYDGATKEGEMFSDVFVQDTTNNFIITGEYGKYNQITDISFVTDKALMTQIFDTDSLFLHADTLWSKKDTSNQKYIQAYNNVRFYKSDMQGVADSLIYSEADSTLTFFNNPIIWSEKNQIIGDTISVTLSNNQPDKLYVNGHAFVISEVLPDYYNQIKGRRIIGDFKDSEIEKLLVLGNVQVLYYPADEEGESPKLIGLNSIECANLEIRLADNQISKLKILEKTNGDLSPIKVLTATDKKLDDFKWEIELKPTSVESLFVEKRIDESIGLDKSLNQKSDEEIDVD